MTFTAIHRALGVGPQPLTEALVDAAIRERVAEIDDLDWRFRGEWTSRRTRRQRSRPCERLPFE